MKYGAVELVKVAFTKEAYKKVSHNLQIYNFRRGLTFFIKLKKMERILIFLFFASLLTFFQNGCYRKVLVCQLSTSELNKSKNFLNSATYKE